MVREATFSDIPKILELIIEGYERSKYKSFELDKEAAKQVLFGSIQRRLVKSEGGTCVFVNEENDGNINGFIVGILDRIYHVSKELMATDLFFYVSHLKNNNFIFVRLLSSFEKWAVANSKVKLIQLGVTDIIGEPQRLGVIYKHRGYKQCGLMFEMATER